MMGILRFGMNGTDEEMPNAQFAEEIYKLSQGRGFINIRQLWVSKHRELESE